MPDNFRVNKGQEILIRIPLGGAVRFGLSAIKVKHVPSSKIHHTARLCPIMRSAEFQALMEKGPPHAFLQVSMLVHIEFLYMADGRVKLIDHYIHDAFRNCLILEFLERCLPWILVPH